MRLDGMHHITMITGEAQRTVDFYAGLLGLRLVKQTVNFDAPEAYHLYFSDELGSPGSILTWFEFRGVQPGRPGAGMIHTIELGVPSRDALGFWEQRLDEHGHACHRPTLDSLKLADPDGLSLELVTVDPRNPPLRALHQAIAPEHAITGVEGARAYISRPPQADAQLLGETLGFTATDAGGGYRLDGPTRRFRWTYEHTGQHGLQGAGSVHHIAWHAADADHPAWRERLAAAGMRVTPIIDREYFRSLYFRQPQGILFELATTSPGFAVDEDPGHMGERLCLPAQHAHLRARLEQTLAPLHNPRATLPAVLSDAEGGR
jgi:glyoxalase family protein